MSEAELLYEFYSPAYHEAGHAIVGLIMGEQIERIDVGWGEESTHKVFAKTRRLKNLAAAFDVDATFWAGVLAEGIAARRGLLDRMNNLMRMGCGAVSTPEANDFTQIHNVGRACVQLEYGTNEQVDKLEFRSALAAGRLLRRNWGALQALADELGECASFAPRDISRALRGHTLVDLAGNQYVVRTCRGYARCKRERAKLDAMKKRGKK